MVAPGALFFQPQPAFGLFYDNASARDSGKQAGAAEGHQPPVFACL